MARPRRSSSPRKRSRAHRRTRSPRANLPARWSYRRRCSRSSRRCRQVWACSPSCPPRRRWRSRRRVSACSSTTFRIPATWARCCAQPPPPACSRCCCRSTVRLRGRPRCCVRGRGPIFFWRFWRTSISRRGRPPMRGRVATWWRWSLPAAGACMRPRSPGGSRWRSATKAPGCRRRSRPGRRLPSLSRCRVEWNRSTPARPPPYACSNACSPTRRGAQRRARAMRSERPPGPALDRSRPASASREPRIEQRRDGCDARGVGQGRLRAVFRAGERPGRDGPRQRRA